MLAAPARRRTATRALPALAALALALGPAAAASASPAEDLVPGVTQEASAETPAKSSGKASSKSSGKDAKAQKSAAAANSTEPGKLKGASIVQTGWWGRSTPQAPETGLLAPPSTPPFLSPEGSIPVAALGGDTERVTAIEFSLNGKTDGRVQKVELALAPVDDPSANPNGDSGVVYACTLTEAFWIGVANGPWDTRPTWDCNDGKAVLGVLGEEDGVWRFDLTGLAQDWLAGDRQFSPAVVLVSEAPENAPEPEPGAQSAETFQVAFDGAEGIGVTAKTKAPAKSNNGNSGTDTGSTGGDVGSTGGGGGGDLGGGGGGDFGGGGDIPALDPAPIDEAPLDAGAPADAGPGEAGAQSTGFTPVAAGPLNWYDGLGRMGLLVVPALMLAYLVMVAMGPSAQPVVGSSDRRGVSRALDRLAQGGVTRLGRNS